MSDRIYKCGVIGFGYMGEIRKRTVDASPRMEMVGVVETDPEKCKSITDCPLFDSIDDLLKVDVDIIFVCTPNVYSPEISIKSMNAGKHVFCEKPPGRTLEDIKAIRKAEVGYIKLMFGFNHRFHPAVLKAKAIVDSGRLGRVINLRGVYGKSGGVGYEKSWRNDKSISGGGILLDQGIHMLDLFRYFCGDFNSVKCFTNNNFWNVEVEDNAFVILEKAGEFNAFFHSSATLWKHTFRMDISLEKGYMVIEGLLSKSGSYGRERLVVGKRQFEDEAEAVGNPAEEITHFDRDLSWEMEVEEFLKCIDQNTPVTASSSTDALRVMEIIDSAYRDAQNNPGES